MVQYKIYSQCSVSNGSIIYMVVYNQLSPSTVPLPVIVAKIHWTASCKRANKQPKRPVTDKRQTPFNTGQTNLPLWADSGQVSPVRSDEAQGGTYTATPTTRNSHSVPPITNQENVTIVIIHKSIARRRCNCYSIYPKENHEFRSDVGRILA